MSEEKTLHEKLYNLQSEVGAISKDSTNPFFKSKYFDINGLLNHIQPLLKKNRLLLTQPILNGAVQSVIECVDTGDSRVSIMELPVISDPQKMGSAITYYRRYTLQSLLALQAEDDDGNSASRQAKQKERKKPVMNSKNERWEPAVHSLAKGEVTIDKIKNKFTLSDKDAEKMIAEAKEFKNEH